MFTVSQAAKLLGLARSTLLYYERIGLVRPDRGRANRYRQYSREDIDRLFMVRQLQKAGLSLKECARCLAGEMPTEMLDERLAEVERRMADLARTRLLLAALQARAGGRNGPPGGEELRQWHRQFEALAPMGHDEMLRRLGFSEKESIYIRMVSKDMTDNETYMKHFFWVHEQVPFQGVGSPETTRRAFEMIPNPESVARIIDIGCGAGGPALRLAKLTKAAITAVDNHQPFLGALERNAANEGLGGRINTVNASMTELPFADESFDLIWAEGSAFVMGVETALEQWRRLVPAGRWMAISEVTWLTEKPSPETVEFFAAEYPDISNIETRQKQAEDCGWRVLGAFVQPPSDWQAYYGQMPGPLAKARKEFGPSRAFDNIEAEIKMYDDHGDEYGHFCMVLEKRA